MLSRNEQDTSHKLSHGSLAGNLFLVSKFVCAELFFSALSMNLGPGRNRFPIHLGESQTHKLISSSFFSDVNLRVMALTMP